RRYLHEALVREEADAGRGSGLVHRRRHRHGAMCRSDRGGRGGGVWLSAPPRMGDAPPRGVGGPGGARARAALPSPGGGEPPARAAAEIGLVLEVVPDASLEAHARALARRIARVPTTQLVMLKLLCNQTVENMGFAASRTLGTLFDGIARHTQEGLDFVSRSGEIGFRDAVRERDDPFGDYGSGPRSKGR